MAERIEAVVRAKPDDHESMPERRRAFDHVHAIAWRGALDGLAR